MRTGLLEFILIVSVVSAIVAGFGSLMESEQATAENVQSIYLSIHGGGH